MDIAYKVGCFVKVYWHGVWYTGQIKERTGDPKLPWRVEFKHDYQGLVERRFSESGIRLLTKNELPGIVSLIPQEKLDKLAGYRGYETVPIEFNYKACSCPTKQLVQEGCTCGGN